MPRLRLPRRYYFEEGMARFYEDAHYAVLRCNENNDCLLAGLAIARGNASSRVLTRMEENSA